MRNHLLDFYSSSAYLKDFILWTSRFPTKLRGRYRDEHIPFTPHTCIASLMTDLTPQDGAFFFFFLITKDEPTWTHPHHPKFIAPLRVRSL